MVAAHYDTKALPGFVGANDGAAGTAAVVSSPARWRGSSGPRGAPELRFVLFDGEEATDDSRPFDRDRACAARRPTPSVTPARSAR